MTALRPRRRSAVAEDLAALNLGDFSHVTGAHHPAVDSCHLGHVTRHPVVDSGHFHHVTAHDHPGGDPRHVTGAHHHPVRGSRRPGRITDAHHPGLGPPAATSTPSALAAPAGISGLTSAGSGSGPSSPRPGRGAQA
ncbi:hypothetical protein ACFSTC_25655 [Nonomuraea ferruginea]